MKIGSSSSISNTEDTSPNMILSTSPMATMHIKTHNNVWTPDQNVTHCTKCNLAFGWVYWKHHCRSCGDICCDACTSKKIEIPEYIPVPIPKDTKNLSYYVSSLKSTQQRVCDSCYVMIQNKISVHEQMVELLKIQ